ncbi:MAG: single-stranded DNA-binding protein [Candidatus Omnitrophica bacterium]|nr:single-stranded DNA-binding protein [Candidatus Omnitrophota bacterium]
MAASLNKVFIMGNLTRDPELRYVPSGMAVANFTVAVNRVYKDKAGEKKEDATFIRVVVWGKMAEVCGEYLAKGRAVLVEGRLQSRTWDSPDGKKNSIVEVIANSVQFIGAKEKDTREGSPKHVPADNVVDLDSEFGGFDKGPGANGDEEIPF